MKTSALGNSRQATLHVCPTPAPRTSEFFQLVVLTCFSFHLVFSEQNCTDSLRGPLGNDLGPSGSGDKLVCLKVAELEKSSSLSTYRLAVLSEEVLF